MDRTLQALMLFALVASACALRCTPCTKERRLECPFPSCITSLVKDVCNCCDVCSKDQGERCGGPWNIAGKCHTGLKCVKPKPPIPVPTNYYFNAYGKCQP